MQRKAPFVQRRGVVGKVIIVRVESIRFNLLLIVDGKRFQKMGKPALNLLFIKVEGESGVFCSPSLSAAASFHSSLSSFMIFCDFVIFIITTFDHFCTSMLK